MDNMGDYIELGNRYLHTNKKRLVFTIIGCAIVAAILFAFLNSFLNFVEHEREEVRKEADYDILVLTNDKDTIQAIVNEDYVTSAYIGKSYSWYDEDDQNLYANALFINVSDKFFMKYYMKKIMKDYGVEAELNEAIAWSYLATSDSDPISSVSYYIVVLFAVLVSYIFAIIGVGILRNSVQISIMERVRDYGQLRCIGATKKQVRAIVFREAFIEESLGIAFGIVLGYVVSIIFCLRMKWPIGFHFIPIIFLAVTFYGDMIFAVGDCIKKALNVSPAEAVRGTYVIKNNKFKSVRSGIWKLIFGIEGDYAYKNIRRNTGRFIKNVGAMAFGLGTVVVMGGFLGSFFDLINDADDRVGYYQQYMEAELMGVSSREEMRSELYSPEALKVITDARGIDEPKYSYDALLYTSQDNFTYEHLNKELLNETYWGKGSLFSAFVPQDATQGDAEVPQDATQGDADMDVSVQDEAGTSDDTGDSGDEIHLVDYDAEMKRQADAPARKKINDMVLLFDSKLQICGYDAEDYSRCEKCLVDGTMDLSPDGVLLVNYVDAAPADQDDDALFSGMETYQLTDLKVGDEIQIVDPVELYDLVQRERKNAEAYDKKKKSEDEDYIPILGSASTEAWIVKAARQKLIEEGKYRTYVIEGILAKDPNQKRYEPTIVVPLDRFQDATGFTEDDYSGFRFHVTNVFSPDLSTPEFYNALYENEFDETTGETLSTAYVSGYVDVLSMMANGFKVMILITVIILVIVMTSIFNTMNVNLSSLEQRRNEFAQLRAIGMTQKSLLKTVVLEGGIVWIVSCVLGVVLGLVVEIALYKVLFSFIYSGGIHVAWLAIIITVVLEFIVLCGTNIKFFKDMQLNIAEELMRNGDGG